MDITPAEPPLLPPGVPVEHGVADVSPHATPGEPLNMAETPKVRTKLRLYAILCALYVSAPASHSHTESEEGSGLTPHSSSHSS